MYSKIIDEDDNVTIENVDLESSSKGKLINVVQKLRQRRTDLNQLASEWASKRNELNSEVKEITTTAKEHKETRDSLNEQVQHHKSERDNLNERASELKETIAELNSKDVTESQIENLESEIDDLTMRQQTEVLDVEDERELVTKIDEKREKLSSYKTLYNKSQQVEEMKEELQEIREQATEHHESMLEVAEKAQENHENMVSLFRDADELREEADNAHSKFIAAQEEADVHHERVVTVQDQIDDMPDTQSPASEQTEQETVDEEASDNLYERFQAGESLTNDDLQQIQNE